MTPDLRGGPQQGLVEREREVGVLARLIERAAAGQGAMALVEGPAGIGKTRLLTEARRQAEAAGAVTLMARAGELERDFPFGVVRQLFEAFVADPETRGRALAGAAAPARVVFASPAEPDAGEDVSFAALHGLFWLTLNLAADRPLLLGVDDLQWADAPSLRFLAYLVRRLEGLPVLIAATMRTSEPGTDPTLLAELAHDPATTSVHPGPLSPDAVMEVIRSRLGPEPDAAFCAACFETTGGNPLLLGQLLGALESDGVAPSAEQADVVRQIGPRAVSRTVLLRLARLPAAAHEVARAVAVFGEGAQLPAVAVLTGLDDADVAAATAALARAEILRPEPPLGFVHPLIRDAVYHDLPPGERELRHARAARVLAANGTPEQVATHLLQVPRSGDLWVTERLHEAATAASRRGAPDSAVTYYKRALEEPPPPDRRPSLLLHLGIHEALLDGWAAADHLREAYPQLTDPQERATAAYVLVRTLFFIGPFEEGVATARAAMRELPPELEDLRRSLEAIEAVIRFAHGVAEPEQMPNLERYLEEPPEGDGPGTKMLHAVTSWWGQCTGGSAAQCLPLALSALEGDALMRADNGLLTVSAAIVADLADHPAGMAVWDKALADAHRRGSLFLLLTVHLWRGWTLLGRGELEEAESLIRESLDESAHWGQQVAIMGYFLTALARVRVERGDPAGARELIGRLGAPPRDTDGYRLTTLAEAEVALAEGRPDAALDAVDRAMEHNRRFVAPGWSAHHSVRARALDRLGRSDEALAVAEEGLARARHWGGATIVGHHLRVRGTIRREDGIADLEEAVAVLEGSPSRLERAKAFAALGSALRRARRPTEAREPLRRALELAEVCGAAGLAEQTRAELYATGSRPRTAALRGVGALTASERRVAGLAADGLTNRDIAQELFVTPKTVELHLSNAYRKLEIRSRRDLAAAMSGDDGDAVGAGVREAAP
jgi:DNA-binding CsgD family transcriptional regulator